jgi:hypothetical protein
MDIHKIVSENDDNISYAPLKNRSQNNIPEYIPSNILMNINSNTKYNTIFTVEDLVKLINKAIYFPFRMQYRQTKHNSNMSQMASDFIKQLAPMKHIMHNDKAEYYINLVTGYKWRCSSYKQCIELNNLDYIKLIPVSQSDGNRIIYISIEGTLIGGFINEPSFVNSLTEKERGFLVGLFSHFDQMNSSGNSLQKHEYFSGVNLSKYMASPTNKQKTNKIRWSNSVKVKLIPSWRNNIVSSGGTRRKNKKKTHKYKSHKKSRKTIYNRNKK